MDYKKAMAEAVYFTNRDVITTSGEGSGLDIGGECRVPGWERGNACTNNNSSNCPNRTWK